MVSWALTRRTTASAMRLVTRATSETLSRRPRPTSCGERYTQWPPSCAMPTSNESRVRRLGFSKQSATVRPALLGEPQQRGRNARGVMADRVLFQPQVPRAAPLVDDRCGHCADALLLDLHELVGRGIQVGQAALGVVRAELVGRRIVIQERDIETRAAQVIGNNTHVVGDAVAIRLPRLG